MSVPNIKDLATALIVTPPSPATTGTSATVESGYGLRLPATPFVATIAPEGQMPTLDNAEQITVTGVSTDTITFSRAYGDTTAKNVVKRWRLYAGPIAAHITGAYTYTDAETTRAEAAEALLAPLASPALIGTPTAPTPTGGDNSTKLATTAFVEGALPTSLPPSGSAGGDLSGTYPNPTVKFSNDTLHVPLSGGTMTGPLTINTASGTNNLVVAAAGGAGDTNLALFTGARALVGYNGATTSAVLIGGTSKGVQLYSNNTTLALSADSTGVVTVPAAGVFTFTQNKGPIFTSNSSTDAYTPVTEYHMTTAYDRPWPNWFDQNGRMQARLGWHDLDYSSGQSHHRFEIKTSADPTASPGNLPNMITRLYIGSDAEDVGMTINTNILTLDSYVDGSSSRSLVQVNAAQQALPGLVGAALRILAGGASANASNLASGDMIIGPGSSQGSSRGAIQFYLTRQGSAGIGTNAPAQAGYMANSGSVANSVIMSIHNTTSFTGTPFNNAFVISGQNAGGLTAYRNVTSNTVGSNMTIQGSGATAAATNKSGGTLLLKSGLSTGSATAPVIIQTPTPSASTSAIQSVAVNNGGSGYAASDVLTISGGTGGTATVNSVAVSGEIQLAAVNNGGTGYSFGDVLTITGGSATATVSGIASGVVTSVSISAGGTGYTSSTGVATTGGTGTGCALNTTVFATGQIKTISLTSTGTGYSLTTGASTSGGTGTGATLNVTPFANADNAYATVATFSNTGLDLGGLKLTSIANGSASTDAAAFGQIPTSASTLGGLLAANNLSDLASTATAITNLGLGALATLSTVSLTTNVTGILPVANGGTGAGTLTGLVKGNGTSAMTAAVAGTDYLEPSGSGAALTGIVTSLSGTANQVRVSASTGVITLSTPQNIDSTASPTFGGLTLNGNTNIDGTAARSFIVGRAASGGGNALTIQAGGTTSGTSNTAGGNLILSSGITTGNTRGNIFFYLANQGSSGTGDNTPSQQIVMYSVASGSPTLALGNTSNSNVGLPIALGNTLALSGFSTGQVQMYRHTTANTAGNSLSIVSGSATSGATDKAAGDLVLRPGISTGQGGGNFRLQTNTRALSTGTSDNTAVDRVIGQSPKSVTNNSATTVATLTIASGSSVSGTLNYSVEVTDGTNYQTEAGVIAYSATNASGTVANNTVTEIGSNQSVTSGTLTVTWTLTTAGTIQVNANSSLTPSTGYPRVTFILNNTTQQAVAIN